MLSDAVSAAIDWTSQEISWVNQEYPSVTIAVISACVLVLWRIWRFTVLPSYYPNDPKELPYWIPCRLSTLALNLKLMKSSPGCVFLVSFRLCTC